jgi:hypothetical protein
MALLLHLPGYGLLTCFHDLPGKLWWTSTGKGGVTRTGLRFAPFQTWFFTEKMKAFFKQSFLIIFTFTLQLGR